MEYRAVSPVGVGHIIGEGAAIFTDLTETMLTALDKQMALSDTAQKPKGSLSKFQLADKYLVMMTLDQGNVELCPCQLLGKRTNILTYICLSLKITK